MSILRNAREPPAQGRQALTGGPETTQANFEWTVAALGAAALCTEKNLFSFPTPEPTFSFSGTKKHQSCLSDRINLEKTI